MSEPVTKAMDVSELDFDIVKHRSAVGVASFLVRMVFLQLVTFVSSVFVSRFLGPFAFGVYGIVANFVFLFIYFSDVGLAAALVQKKTKLKRRDLTTTFTIQQSLVLTLVVIIFIALPLIQPWLKFGSDGLWLGRALAISLFLASLKSVPSVLLERRLKFNLLVIPEIAETIVFNVVLVTLAILSFEVKSFTYAVLARGLVGVLVIYLVAPWRIGFGFNKKSAKELLKFGFPFQLNSILAWFKDNLMDNAVALILGSPTAFGYLSWGRNVSHQPRKIMDSVLRVLFPVFSRLQDRKDILAKALSKTYFLLGVSMFPAIVGICVLIKPLILYLYGGPKWLPAVPVVYFLSIALLWGIFNSVATSALSAIGQIKVVLKFMVMVTIATWVLTIPMTLIWGFQGAAASFAISGVVSVWSIRKCAQVIEINFIRDMGSAAISSLIMGVIVYSLGRFWVDGFWPLAAVIALGVVIYSSLIFILEGQRLLKEATNVLGKQVNFSMLVRKRSLR